MSKIIVTQVQSNLSGPVLTLPTAAPTGTQLIQTDVSGNLSFTDALPSNTTATNITASGTITGGQLVAPFIRSSSLSSNFTWPAADGTAGQYLQTNGNGVLSFSSLVVSLFGTSNPTTSTVAAPGVVFVNTVSLQYFVCVGTRTSGGSTIYMWAGSQGTNIGIVQGQQAFTTAGTFSWTAPDGVTSVSVVAVGGGGGGNGNWAASAGSGGGLGWRNNIAVVPGTSYTVQVGAGGSYGSGSNATAGGNSFFNTLATVAGYGGGNQTSGADTGGPNANSRGGGWVGDGGGAGGHSSSYFGGGGAGGYAGNGGNNTSGQGSPGNGGGGAAGTYYSSTYGTGAGGGVGILGQGNSGQPTPSGSGGGGGGGSGGANGANGEPNQPGPAAITGGAYGGGGGGPGTSYGGGNGGVGAVRIIWGVNRAFPATNTADVTPVS